MRRQKFPPTFGHDPSRPMSMKSGSEPNSPSVWRSDWRNTNLTLERHLRDMMAPAVIVFVRHAGR
jgi:hypothetical protein